MNTAQHQYLTTIEAAAYIRLSRRTLEAYRVRGGGPPYVKAGRRCLYRQIDLDAWMASKIRRSTSDQGQDSGAESCDV